MQIHLHTYMNNWAVFIFKRSPSLAVYRVHHQGAKCADWLILDCLLLLNCDKQDLSQFYLLKPKQKVFQLFWITVQIMYWNARMAYIGSLLYSTSFIWILFGPTGLSLYMIGIISTGINIDMHSLHDCEILIIFVKSTGEYENGFPIYVQMMEY